VIHVIPGYKGFLVAMLPPGAFIGLGLLIAGHNWVTLRRARSAPRSAVAAAEA
jgi:electron transport complex protein RnfE